MSSQFRNQSDPWDWAIQLCETYLKRPCKVDELLGELPDSLPPETRRRCQFLFSGFVRNYTLIAWAINSSLQRKPRLLLKSTLYISLSEILGKRGEGAAKVVDHAVGRAKKRFSSAEAGFVNAVLRKASRLLSARLEEASRGEMKLSAEEKTAFWRLVYSHPAWLIARWRESFSDENTEKLLQWNQKPPPIYVRLREDVRRASSDTLAPTPWHRFFRFGGGDWGTVLSLVEKGEGFIMDPAGRLPVALLRPERGEKILDLCSAPGGKARLISEKLESANSFLLCLDKGGSRMDKLEKTLARASHCETVSADLLETTPRTLENLGYPALYDGVLLDAPCTNTGVLRRRPDARWRLRPEDIGAAAALQLRLLRQASRFVRSGGRLVYSTCSVEREENEKVVDSFLEGAEGRFHLQKKFLSKPWRDRHDGGGAFLLKKTGPVVI